ncbi:P-loop NTPase family protein [Roseixanthobacter pseudopolyaromaticivorans]|uniref:hypothetical protein n=1 Tax=Xanthobacteraceae TaxID=335928 RepID=UPI00372636D1
MRGRSLREVESIYLSTFGQGARAVGITSVHSGSGVSALAAALAVRSQRQNRTLLVGLADPTAAVPAQATVWTPADPDLLAFIDNDPRGFDTLIAAPLPEASFAFRSAAAIRAMVDLLLESYDAIVLDLAAVEPRERVAVPVASIAGACDSLVVLCMAGRDSRAALARAAAALRSANAPLSGIVMNDRFNQSVADEITSEARRYQRFAPRLIAKLIAAVGRIKFLNVKP